MLIDNFSQFLGAVLVCPISKEPMTRLGDDFHAPAGFVYKNGDLRVGLEFNRDWANGQRAFERWQQRRLSGKGAEYFAAIDAETVDVYEAIRLHGKVLDVGGGLGTAAAQAGIDKQSYISIDAFPLLWRDMLVYRGVTSHYAQCADLCRVPAHAEFLPIASGTMDFVHMRSCLDHFANPTLALREAYRVLGKNGHVVVGISLEGAYKKENKTSYEKFKAFVKRNGVTREIYERLFDHHQFHPTHESVKALLTQAGFLITKEHWACAYHGVLYVSARKMGKATCTQS